MIKYDISTHAATHNYSDKNFQTSSRSKNNLQLKEAVHNNG